MNKAVVLFAFFVLFAMSSLSAAIAEGDYPRLGTPEVPVFSPKEPETPSEPRGFDGECVLLVPEHTLMDIYEDVGYYKRSFNATFLSDLCKIWLEYYNRILEVPQAKIDAGIHAMDIPLFKTSEFLKPGYNSEPGGVWNSFFGHNRIGVPIDKHVTIIVRTRLPAGAGDFDPKNPRHVEIQRDYLRKRDAIEEEFHRKQRLLSK